MINFRRLYAIKMKKVKISILLSIFCLTSSGQQINQPTNLYRGGDVLEKKQVIVNGFSLNGNNGVWSLEDADISKKAYSTEYTTENDTIMMLERGNRTYYDIKNNIVRIIGSENAQEVISHDMPETWLNFPMYKGDSISGYFNGTGKYCDHLFMRRYGTYLTKTDAVGKLVLPSGDTLRNVVRLHTERYVGTIATPIDTIKRQIPVFTVDSIINHLANDTAKIREDIYRWYAEGYRYPVLEAKVVSSRNEKLSEEMFYCPPEMQEQLAFDDENKQIRSRLSVDDGNSSTKATEEHDNGSPQFNYQYSKNEEGQIITINYTTPSHVMVSALLTNNQGVVYRQASKVDGTSITLSYGGLPRGQYILYINAGGEQYAEKFKVR